METNSALVRTDGVVVLDAVTHISLHIAFVVDPVDTELNHSVWYTQTLDEVVAVEFRMFVVLLLNGPKYLGNGLDVLRLSGKF